MKKMTLSILCGLGIAFVASTAMAVDKGTIEVSAYNFPSDDGLAIVSLFKSANGFPGKINSAYKSFRLKIKGGIVAVQFTDVPYGTYAVQVTQDKNKNGKLDANFMGIPSEPAGSSNSPPGIPKWDACKFEHKSPVTKIKRVKMWTL